MFLRVLLASLGGLAHLLPDRLPLVVFVLLDGGEQRRFLLSQFSAEQDQKNPKSYAGDVPRPRRIRRNACPCTNAS